MTYISEALYLRAVQIFSHVHLRYTKSLCRHSSFFAERAILWSLGIPAYAVKRMGCKCHKLLLPQNVLGDEDGLVRSPCQHFEIEEL